MEKKFCQNFYYLLMTETKDSKALKKIVDSLVYSRYSPQKMDFDEEEDEEEKDGEYIKIPFSTDDNKTPEQIALYIKKSQKELPGNPIVLFTHGDGEDLESYISYKEYFCPFGVSFCVMDYRGTGYSDGPINTSGVNETKDVIEVIKYLKTKGYEKISYFGRSLGAECGIYAAAHFPDLVCLAFDSGSIDTKALSIYQLNYFKKIEKSTIERLWPEACKIINEKYGIDFLT